MVKTGAAAEAAAPAAAASVLISCFTFILYFGFSFDLILFFAFVFANTGSYVELRRAAETGIAELKEELEAEEALCTNLQARLDTATQEQRRCQLQKM